MSNYNSQLQSNNTDLQRVLQTLQTKAAGGTTEWSANEDAIINRTISGAYVNNRVTTIGLNAFHECSSLTSVSFPAATTIKQGAFEHCYNLITADFPACINIGEYAFYFCYNLTTISFPACTTIDEYAFYRCNNNLTTVSFPACINIGKYAFVDCSHLTTVSFPVVRFISYEAFKDCYALTTVSFPAATVIEQGAFNYCSELASVFLAKQSVAILSHANTFLGTKMSTTGWFYVPSSLIESYKTATNWTYYSSRFSAIENSLDWDGVYGDGSVILITFYIDNVAYQAKEGMSFGEWVQSSYNVDGKSIPAGHNGATLIVEGSYYNSQGGT